MVLSKSSFVSGTVNAMFVCCSFVLSSPFIAQNIFYCRRRSIRGNTNITKGGNVCIWRLCISMKWSGLKHCVLQPRVKKSSLRIVPNKRVLVRAREIYLRKLNKYGKLTGVAIGPCISIHLSILQESRKQKYIFFRTSILRPHVHYFSLGFIMAPATILFHLRLLTTLGWIFLGIDDDILVTLQFSLLKHRMSVRVVRMTDWTFFSDISKFP